MNAAAAVAQGQAVFAASFDAWRSAARELLAHGIAPHLVQWTEVEGGGDLFAQAQGPAVREPEIESGKLEPPFQLHVSRTLMELIQNAACCRVPDRWAFLYRVLWRWQQGEHDVASPADEDGARLAGMAKAVSREIHDMHAYVRFRERAPELGPPRFVAWFEPRHDVLPQVADHFRQRMGGTTWMIATPDATVMWDSESLHFTGPLLTGAADIEDAGEALWLTYYRSIFNPARLNTQVMQSHIPSRFWKNLPEGAIVPAMVTEAANGARRTGQAQAVGQRKGRTVPVAPESAQPEREQPSTLDQCRRCDLWKNATQAVGGEGPKRAKIMLVGEQPGDQEDIAGHPFVGPAGQLLDRAIAQAGIDRDKLYVTNAVKHFKWEPRGKRRMHKTPAQREVDACRYWLEGEMASVRPQVVVALGSTALKAVLDDPSATLKEAIGEPFLHGGRWVVATYHPSYALRVPDAAAREQAFDAIVVALERARQLGREESR
ncbi:MAG TPA: UdgX family uracil-DNA binding protein [Telluria sp.]|nr:UdgX family uracil-DNA binding protein [Telluria sp.]